MIDSAVQLSFAFVSFSLDDTQNPKGMDAELQEFLIGAILEWKLAFLNARSSKKSENDADMTLGELLAREDRDQLAYLGGILDEALLSCADAGELGNAGEQIRQACSDFLATAQGFDERLEAVRDVQRDSKAVFRRLIFVNADRTRASLHMVPGHFKTFI